LDSNIVVQYFVGPIITLHGQITAREYVGKLDNKVHPMIQRLFLNDAPIYTAVTVQSHHILYQVSMTKTYSGPIIYPDESSCNSDLSPQTVNEWKSHGMRSIVYKNIKRLNYIM
jgi:hypothetical protein